MGTSRCVVERYWIELYLFKTAHIMSTWVSIISAVPVIETNTTFAPRTHRLRALITNKERIVIAHAGAVTVTRAGTILSINHTLI